jgi:hypothetical protein
MSRYNRELADHQTMIADVFRIVLSHNSLYIAHGLNCELENQTLLCGDLGYFESPVLNEEAL